MKVALDHSDVSLYISGDFEELHQLIATLHEDILSPKLTIQSGDGVKDT